MVPPVSLTLRMTRGTRVSAGFKGKREGLAWLLGSKEKGSAQVRNGPARVTAQRKWASSVNGSQAGSACRAGKEATAQSAPPPLFSHLQAWPTGQGCPRPLTSGARLSMERRIWCGKTDPVRLSCGVVDRVASVGVWVVCALQVLDRTSLRLVAHHAATSRRGQGLGAVTASTYRGGEARRQRRRDLGAPAARWQGGKAGRARW